MQLSIDKTYSFSEANVREILADYLKREHQVEVKPEDFRLSISDSTTTGYMDNEHVPAKLNSISVVVKG